MAAHLVPYLMPLAFVALAGMRYLRFSSPAPDTAAAWAVRKGFLPGEPPMTGATPILRLPMGEASGCWEVPIGDGSGTLFRWTWVVEDDRSPMMRELNEPVGMRTAEVSVVQAMLAAGFPHFRVVPHRGFVAPAGDWDEEPVELESVEFGQRFRLLAGHDGDREALLRLFDPETIVWFIGLGEAAPVVEYGLGTLDVATRYACTTDVEHEALLEAAQRIAKRVLAEGLLHQPDPA
ncbi:MAG TPA: hypothetical protein VFH74_01515 [Gaiellales bacterium]|nr:hypothetical protein [Gaiellales bacterium]